jgi:hypothetical protein
LLSELDEPSVDRGQSPASFGIRHLGRMDLHFSSYLGQSFASLSFL